MFFLIFQPIPAQAQIAIAPNRRYNHGKFWKNPEIYQSLEEDSLNGPRTYFLHHQARCHTP